MKECPNCKEQIEPKNQVGQCQYCKEWYETNQKGKLITKKFETSKLYNLANKYLTELTEEEKLENQNVTELFYQEIDDMIKNGEIVIININAKMRLGKSTEAMAIGTTIFNTLKKYGYRKPHETFGIKNIARDQQEYSRIMMNPETQFTVIVTDESNELEKGGENSSVEESLRRVFSDVQAARYNHEVSCSPKEIINPNADILLEVVGIDKQRKMTHNRLYYRMLKRGIDHTQLLGYVNIYVGDIIKNWEKIKKIFYKTERTPQEEQTIQEWRKKDWYIEYVIKKHQKMDMLTKEGIFRPRILEYAKIILETVNELKELTKYTRVVNKDLIRSTLKIRMRENKIPMSIIGEELATREVNAIIELYKNYFRLEKEFIETRNKKMENQEAKENILQEIKEAQHKIVKAIREQKKELIKYGEIQEKYNTIES